MNMCETKTKVCNRCKQEKPLIDFYKNKRTKDGYQGSCKLCKKIENNNWKNKNPDYYKNYFNGNDDFKEYKKEYYEKNKIAILKKNKTYHIENREKVNVMRLNYIMNRYHSDPMFKMKMNMRRTISRNINQKKLSSNIILGCSWDTFKTHIENQFQEGMTWDNYGEWHYDHIMPISSAKTEEDVYRLNHYTNFQPLWAEDNLRKSDKISEEWGNIGD